MVESLLPSKVPSSSSSIPEIKKKKKNAQNSEKIKLSKLQTSCVYKHN